MWINFKYGMSDFAEVKLTGPYRVGFRDFSSKSKVDCSVWYPCEDNGGIHGVNYLAYGKDDAKGFHDAMKEILGEKQAEVIPNFANVSNSIKIPVQRNAPLRKDKQQIIQPIIFSHGLSNHRNGYSVLCRELASNGFLVISVVHNDGSAGFSPYVGGYERPGKFYDYQLRNKQIKIREEDVIQLAHEIYEPNRFAQFGSDWKGLKLSENLIFYGHSFGGITALSAATKCEKVKAIVSLDPWFFPYNKEAMQGLRDD